MFLGLLCGCICVAFPRSVPCSVHHGPGNPGGGGTTPWGPSPSLVSPPSRACVHSYPETLGWPTHKLTNMSANSSCQSSPSQAWKYAEFSLSSGLLLNLDLSSTLRVFVLQLFSPAVLALSLLPPLGAKTLLKLERNAQLQTQFSDFFLNQHFTAFQIATEIKSPYLSWLPATINYSSARTGCQFLLSPVTAD